MKKGLILFVALTLLTAVGAFAKVTAVKDGDAVKVTWTYANADAGSVGLVGDFQGWKLAAAVPFTKGADGVWSISMTGKADSIFIYKFNVDGEWTEDPEAPASKDDGFGGQNGLANVGDLLAAASGTAAPKSKVGILFGTFASAYSNTAFRTTGYNAGTKGFSLQSQDLKAKWYAKFSGYGTENLKIYGELRILDGGLNFYTKGLNGAETTTWSQGFGNAYDALFNPANAIGPAYKDSSYAGKFVASLENANVRVSTYSNWAAPGARQADDPRFLYRTIRSDANAGVLEVANLKPITIGGGALDFVVGPNKQVGGAYGLYSTIDYAIAGQKFGLMYGGLATRSDVYDITTNASHEVGIGAKLKFGAITVLTDNVLNFTNKAGIYTNAYQNSTFGLKVSYASDAFNLTVKGIESGYNATMLYGDVADDFTNIGQLYAEVFPSVTVGALTIGLDAGAYLDAAFADKTNQGFDGKLTGSYNLDTAGKLGYYATVSYGILPAGTNQFAFREAGVEYTKDALTLDVAVVNDVTVTKNIVTDSKAKVLYTTAIVGYDTSATSKVLGGLTYRMAGPATADASVINPVGGLIGYNLKLTDAALMTPWTFVNFTYNMDPFAGADNYQFKWKNYRPDSLDNNNGLAALRVGIRWDF